MDQDVAHPQVRGDHPGSIHCHHLILVKFKRIESICHNVSYRFPADSPSADCPQRIALSGFPSADSPQRIPPQRIPCGFSADCFGLAVSSSKRAKLEKRPMAAMMIDHVTPSTIDCLNACFSVVDSDSCLSS